MKLTKSWAVAAAMVALTGAAQAALVNRGGGMIYDTTLNITWLADWNHAETSGYAAANAGGTGGNPIVRDGRMGWDAAKNWANNLVYGGYADWRLPTSLNGDGTGPCGPAWFICSGSEMGHMFYNNWDANPFNDFSTGTKTTNLALFSNVESLDYWSGTEYALNPDAAWVFGNGDGYQNYGIKSRALSAVAVRPGDVASVPEPQTLALVLLALGSTVVARRRRPA